MSRQASDNQVVSFHFAADLTGTGDRSVMKTSRKPSFHVKIKLF